ncbi:MAG TPA: type I-E CRISPR-associated protein Cse1/CasA [Clostridiales bacterium]|nr:type I-E CRISPR-associated protein Cse1/CasA [Clostridiales bacterium]
MDPAFNLVTEPWIPCLMPSGETCELGLQETLERAHEVRAIFDPFPPVSASLHRLLLAVLHRNFGPRNREEWTALWKRGSWDARVLGRYFEEFFDRFYLFHPDHPFYQNPNLKPKEEAGDEGYELSILTKQALSAGSRATLFDHSLTKAPRPVPAAAAARLAVAYQAYFLGGLVSRRKGERPAVPAAPLAKGAAVLFEGKNLFETLMLNTVAYDVEAGEPFEAQFEDDSPAWEQDPPSGRTARAPRGYLDYLTWQSIGLRLFPERLDGDLVVRYCIIAGGTDLEDDGFTEPFFAYRANPTKKPKSGDLPWDPVRHSSTRALWRDSTALLSAGTPHEKPPLAAKWLADLTARGVLDRSARYRVSVFGLGSRQAKVDFWRHETFPVAATYLVDAGLVARLRDALTHAERVGGALRWCLRPGDRGDPRASGPEEAPEELPESVVESALSEYWSRLEQPFNILLADLPSDSEGKFSEWVAEVNNAARRAFDYAVQSLGLAGETLKLVTEARSRLEGRLRRITRSVEEDGHDEG